MWQDFKEEEIIEWQVCSLRSVSAKGFSPKYRNQENAPAIARPSPDDFTGALTALSLHESQIDLFHGATGTEQLIVINAPLDTTPARRLTSERDVFSTMITLIAKTDHFWFGCEKKDSDGKSRRDSRL